VRSRDAIVRRDRGSHDGPLPPDAAPEEDVIPAAGHERRLSCSSGSWPGVTITDQEAHLGWSPGLRQEIERLLSVPAIAN
jgi:hypothetical protein